MIYAKYTKLVHSSQIYTLKNNKIGGYMAVGCGKININDSEYLF